jgi:hypothetical protein
MHLNAGVTLPLKAVENTGTPWAPFSTAMLHSHLYFLTVHPIVFAALQMSHVEAANTRLPEQTPAFACNCSRPPP